MMLPDAVKAAAQQQAQWLVGEVPGIQAVVVATVDGFDVASVMAQSTLEPALVAALASSIASIGEVVSQQASLGTSRSVTVSTDKGLAIVCNVPRQDVGLVICAVTNETALLGLLNYGMGSVAKVLGAA